MTNGQRICIRNTGFQPVLFMLPRDSQDGCVTQKETK
jgi:hypothetical protein